MITLFINIPPDKTYGHDNLSVNMDRSVEEGVTLVNPYPSWASVQQAIGNDPGMKIIFDTYTRTLHDKCASLYAAVMSREKEELNEDDKTCEMYVEIVLCRQRGSMLKEFKAIRQESKDRILRVEVADHASLA